MKSQRIQAIIMQKEFHHYEETGFTTLINKKTDPMR